MRENNKEVNNQQYNDQSKKVTSFFYLVAVVLIEDRWYINESEPIDFILIHEISKIRQKQALSFPFRKVEQSPTRWMKTLLAIDEIAEIAAIPAIESLFS